MDSLTCIRTPVSDIDLVQLTLSGLDEGYHTLVTTLSYGTNLLTFDYLHCKLIHHEQRLKFLKTKESFRVQHQALATSITFNHGNGSGGGKDKGKHNNRKGNQNQGGGNRNYNTNQHQHVGKANNAGTAFGDTISSWSHVQCLSPLLLMFSL